MKLCYRLLMILLLLCMTKVYLTLDLQIQLSGSDSSDSDEEEDDTVLYTEEVRSTVDQYSLRELRLPKTICELYTVKWFLWCLFFKIENNDKSGLVCIK